MAYEDYHTKEYYKQHRAMIVNGAPRAPIVFCVDVSTSMRESWFRDDAVLRTSGRIYSDGHNIDTIKRDDIIDSRDSYKKIDKLNEVLATLLADFKRDANLRDKVAVSIVAYSKYSKVVHDFLDCRELDIKSCECKVDAGETEMKKGIATALGQIDEMENDMKQVGNDAYTPILVFLTDGVPTDNPSAEFGEIRQRVENGELIVFPLGIGHKAEMSLLREMFPEGRVPENFEEKYKMVEPESYDRIFEEIKSYVKRKNSVMVSEGNSTQSAPAIEDVKVMNNQMGEAFDPEDYRYLL